MRLLPPVLRHRKHGDAARDRQPAHVAPLRRNHVVDLELCEPGEQRVRRVSRSEEELLAEEGDELVEVHETLPSPKRRELLRNRDRMGEERSAEARVRCVGPTVAESPPAAEPRGRLVRGAGRSKQLTRRPAPARIAPGAAGARPLSREKQKELGAGPRLGPRRNLHGLRSHSARDEHVKRPALGRGDVQEADRQARAWGLAEGHIHGTDVARDVPADALEVPREAPTRRGRGALHCPLLSRPSRRDRANQTSREGRKLLAGC